MKRKGICSICGCTEADACEDGCYWANRQQTLCSTCEPLSDVERKERRDLSLASLADDLERATDYALELKLRMSVLESEAAAAIGKRGGSKRTAKQAPRFPKVAPT